MWWFLFCLFCNDDCEPCGYWGSCPRAHTDKKISEMDRAERWRYWGQKYA